MDFDGVSETPLRTLLLVDNERGILSALQRLLRKDGYRILTAENGLAGLDLMASHDVGVVVSDGLMTGMDGAEFLLEVKARHPHTVRILLTGFTDPAVVHAAIKTCGLFRFLPKPWDDDQLRDAIRAAFRHHESLVREVAYHHG